LIKGLIANRIRELRNAKRLSQEALAGRAGLTPRMLQAIEGQERLPSLDSLVKLSEALGVPASALLEQPPADEALRLQQRGMEILRTLSTRDLRTAIAVLQALADEAGRSGEQL
jgi:transcriptional regulator with XRE-family HTH domain